MRRTEEMTPTKIKRKEPDEPETVESIAEAIASSLGDLVEVRLPGDCDEPILSPTVRRTVREWMLEQSAEEELRRVGVKPRLTCLLNGPPGCGKAQPIDAPVLLANGEWVAIGTLTVGDKLASIDGTSSVVEGIFPQGELDVWEVMFSDGARVECGEDHLWTIESKEWASSKVVRTGDLPKMLMRPSMSGRLRVPLFSGDFESERPLPLDPYLIGLLIGDGCFTSGRCVAFCAPTPEILERFRSALPSSDEARHVSRFDYRITRKQRDNSPSAVRQALDFLGLSECKSHEKFIPRAYLAASRESRRRLLMGLLDTDGHTERGGKVCYSTSSERLAQDVRDLVNGLGGLVSVRAKIPTYTHNGENRTGRMAWIVTLLAPFGRDLATLDRHKRNLVGYGGIMNAHRRFISVAPTGERCQMVCIKVSHPSETYITNNYVVTHNTTLAHHFAARLGMPLVVANGEMIVSSYLGATGQNIYRLFSTLRKFKGKTVGFFDEFDSIATARGGDRQAVGKEQNAIVTALLTNIERHDGLFFAATNRGSSLDSAIWRRFGMQIEVEIPGFDERFAILKRYLMPFVVSDDTLDELCLLTNGAAPALIRQLCEGIKRSLVIGPRMKRDIADIVAIVQGAAAQIAPHADFEPPPLWKAPEMAASLAGKPWPPVLGAASQ
jgi:hypothetical protein